MNAREFLRILHVAERLKDTPGVGGEALSKIQVESASFCALRTIRMPKINCLINSTFRRWHISFWRDIFTQRKLDRLTFISYNMANVYQRNGGGHVFQREDTGYSIIFICRERIRWDKCGADLKYCRDQGSIAIDISEQVSKAADRHAPAFCG